jgi:hypothetical protein
MGVFVRVGGKGVFVLVIVGGRGVGLGGLGVRVGTTTLVAVPRGFLVKVGVIVTNCLCVSVGCGVADGGTSVLVGVMVSVGTKTVTTCSVSAATVPKLETARSTRLIGSRVMGI